MNNLELKGIIPATVLPMDKNYRIDDRSLASYIGWLGGYKLGGVAVNADTGEGPHLTQEERIRVIKAYKRGLKGGIPVISGLAARYTEEAVKYGKELVKAGADALLVFPISAFMGQPLSWKVPYEYYKAINDKVGAPIVAFQLQPALGGANFDKATIEKLITLKNVAAIKEASFDALRYVQTVNIVKNAPRRITMLTGNDNFIYESFLLGGEGALIGFGTLLVQEQIDMYKAAMRGDYAEGERLNSIVAPLSDYIFSSPARDYRVRTKEALKLLKVIRTSYVRPPLMPVEKNDIGKLKVALKKAGLL